MTRGLPDHYRHTLISRREVALELQQNFWYWMSSYVNVGHGIWVSDIIYTVPEGKRLVVEFVNFSCNTLEVNQFGALGRLEAEAFIYFLGTDFLAEKFVHCHRPLEVGYGLRILISQRDRYKPRDFQVMIHGYTEPA